MAFKTKLDLDADTTISIGGVNFKTNKPNPLSVEGYYLGHRKVESDKAKAGFTYLHIFQTAKGNIAVWGKMNMDSKLLDIAPGTMTRVTFDKMVRLSTGNAMYKYHVEEDTDNSIVVSSSPKTIQNTSEEESEVEAYESAEETSVDADEEALDEVPHARPVAPKVAAKAPSADRQAKVAALLNRNKSA